MTRTRQSQLAPPATLDAPASRWQRRKDARAGELLAAALALSGEPGGASMRLEDVAARAGVTKGTIYRYFKNRRQLLVAVVREQIKLLAPDTDLAATAGGNSTDQLRMVTYAWWQQMRQANASGLFALLMAEGSNFPHLARYCHQQTIARYRTTISSILERAVASAEFHPVDIASTTQLLITPMLALLMHQCTHGAACGCLYADPAFPDVFLDAMLRGLAAEVE